MNRIGAVNALRALIESSDDRSQTARLFAMIDDVEAALAAGVRRAAIVDTLAANGLPMTLKNFETALYRIRKRRSQTGRKTATRPPPTTSDGAMDIAPRSALGSNMEEFAGLESRQRRERVADKFIRPETTNPLVQSILKERKQ